MNKFPDEEPLTYKEWLLLPPGHVKKRVAIIVSFDMGWQHHGFCLLSWYTFMIGAQSSNIIDIILSEFHDIIIIDSTTHLFETKIRWSF